MGGPVATYCPVVALGLRGGLGMTGFFDIFPGPQATLVAAACRVMQERGLGPADVLAQYDEHIRLQATGQQPQTAPPARQQGDTPRRTRAGDRAEVAGACPACGGTLELVQLCPQASPHWRTQTAVDRKSVV